MEHASNVAFEYQKNANKYQEAIRQSSMQLDEEQKTKALYLKYRLRRLKDEGLVKTLIDEAQSSPEKLIENINSKIDKLTKDKQKSSLLSLLSLLCLSFFALTDFVVGDMYVIVIILLGIFFIGFSISASSTESKIQLLEKERKKMKNSAKISSAAFTSLSLSIVLY